MAFSGSTKLPRQKMWNMITIPIEDVEGLLGAVEDFFGPEIFSINTSEDGKVANLHKYGAAVKALVTQKRAQEQAAKQITEAIEKFKEEGDEDNLQEFLDETVHDFASIDGSATNNAGWEDQILFIIEGIGEKEVRRQLGEIFLDNDELRVRIMDPYGQES
jgi:hypothetical protein